MMRVGFEDLIVWICGRTEALSIPFICCSFGLDADGHSTFAWSTKTTQENVLVAKKWREDRGVGRFKQLYEYQDAEISLAVGNRVVV